MNRDFFEFSRTHKIILQTNNKPVIRETSNAIWRRIRLIPFNVTIAPADQDPLLLDRLVHERPGILAWAVRGCLDWLKNGLGTPATVTVATETYRSDQDPLCDYIADRCVRGARNVKVTRNDLDSDYQGWCVEVGEKHPMDRAALFDYVRKIPGVAEASWRTAGLPSPVRGFRGIGLAAQPTAEPEDEAVEV